jgi:hypothetical protein
LAGPTLAVSYTFELGVKSVELTLYTVEVDQHLLESELGERVI